MSKVLSMGAARGGGAWEKDLHDRWWTSKLPFPSTLSSTPHTAPPPSPAVQPLRALLKAGQSTWMDSPVASPSPPPSFSCAQQCPQSRPSDTEPRLLAFVHRIFVRRPSGCPHSTNTPSWLSTPGHRTPSIKLTSISQYTIITPPTCVPQCMLSRTFRHSSSLCLRLPCSSAGTYLVPESSAAQTWSTRLDLPASSPNSPALAGRPPHPTHPPQLALALAQVHHCGPYYKLDGSAHPISKSDIIRERLPHDARRAEASALVSETPTASPDVSRRVYPRHGPASSASPSDSTDSDSQTHPQRLSTNPPAASSATSLRCFGGGRCTRSLMRLMGEGGGRGAATTAVLRWDAAGGSVEVEGAPPVRERQGRDLRPMRGAPVRHHPPTNRRCDALPTQSGVTAVRVGVRVRVQHRRRSSAACEAGQPRFIHPREDVGVPAPEHALSGSLQARHLLFCTVSVLPLSHRYSQWCSSGTPMGLEAMRDAAPTRAVGCLEANYPAPHPQAYTGRGHYGVAWRIEHIVARTFYLTFAGQPDQIIIAS
ncbi:hypothetical protein B0H14DRAFT_3437021 [Mycena olivaceomarginata]|nr:hypothetical protein B0H14DRAFT_3437021 [Mycena olivaceomarginata]